MFIEDAAQRTARGALVAGDINRTKAAYSATNVVDVLSFNYGELRNLCRLDIFKPSRDSTVK